MREKLVENFGTQIKVAVPGGERQSPDQHAQWQGVIASWHWPERMAARTLDLPMWEAGQRLMNIANPETWRAIVAGDIVVQANRETIEECRKAAVKARDTVRCTIKVSTAP